MKWSTDHSHSLTHGKISWFLNKKLDVAKSRKMVNILSGYLDFVKSSPTKLPENLAFEIDKVKDKLTNFGNCNYTFFKI